jgi:hypothetical protein
MTNVLTNASTITCEHTATALLTSTAKLKVAGNAVLLDGDTITLKPGMCTQLGSGLTPCTSVTVTGGQSTKLKVNGKAVLTESIVGKTNGSPTFTFTASAGQSKLSA